MKKQPGKVRAWCIKKLGGYAYERPPEQRVTMYTMPVEKIRAVVNLSGFIARDRNKKLIQKGIQGEIIHEISSELVHRGIVKITERQTDIGVEVIGTLIVGVPGEDGDA